MSNTPSLLPCPFCGGINIIHCWHHMYCHACGADGPDADSQHESEARSAWNRRTPQPVVREPLTCEWTHNDDDGYWDTSCGKAWRFDDGGPKENNMNFCHCCGKTLRIKGKEAVNADT